MALLTLLAPAPLLWHSTYLIINIRAQRLNGSPIARRRIPLRLLLVQDIVLDTGLHTRTLHPDDRVLNQNAREICVRAESFPIAPAKRRPPERAYYRSESNVRAFLVELSRYIDATLVG